MYYDNYHFAGMHLLWWGFWGILVFWIFAIPYDIPGQRKRKYSPQEMLKRRFASGQMSKTEYLENKKILEG